MLRAAIALSHDSSSPVLVAWGPDKRLVANPKLRGLTGSDTPAPGMTCTDWAAPPPFAPVRQAILHGDTRPVALPDARIAAFVCIADGATSGTLAVVASTRELVALDHDLDALTQIHTLAMRLVRDPADVPALLSAIVDAAIAVTGADMGYLQLFDEHAGVLRTAAHRGFGDTLADALAVVAPGTQCASGAALATGAQVVVDEVATSRVFMDGPAREALLAAGARAVQSTPVRTRSGRLVGMLSTQYRLPGEPAARDLQIVDLLARQSAEMIEHVQHEQAAAKQQEVTDRIEQLLRTVAEPVLIIRDERVIYANAQSYALLGYDVGELVGLDHSQLIPEDARAAHSLFTARYYEAPVARPMGSRSDVRARRKDGTVFPAEISLNPVETLDGLAVSIVLRDVTHQRALESALKIQTARLFAAVEAMPDAVFVFDERGVLVSWNEQADKVAHESLGLEVHGSLVLDDLARATAQAGGLDVEPVAAVEPWRSGGAGPWTEEHDLAGRRFRFHSRDLPGGGQLRIIIDLTDDVRNARELVRARYEAEAASRAKDEFLASMSHELRTPLNAVLGFTQLLIGDRREPPSARQRGLLERVLQGGEQLLRIVDDILDFARIAARGLSVSPEPVSIEEVLDEVMTGLSVQAEAAGVTLGPNAVAASLPHVRADRGRFVQTLLNLGTNAIKYNRRGGWVRFSADRVGERVRVTVTDDGVGIGPAHRERLFEPFHRGAQETGPIEGTGIGLAMVKRLARLMDGDVGYAPHEERGSRFWIELPVSRDESTNTASAIGKTRAAPPPRRMRGRVLYVEDNPTNIELVRELVGTLDGLELVAAHSAEAGLALAVEARPDLVLMDINLPGMNGVEALRALRARPETQQIPVIAVTAAARAEDRERCLAAGFDDYVRKPIDIALLETVMERVLARRSP
jgi:PAS domain S-box-containing protein